MSVRSVACAGFCLAALAGQAAGAPRRAVLTIKSLESDKPAVEASFNPKELSIDKSVAWATDPASTEDDPAIRYVGPVPRTLQVVLTFEDRTDVRPILAALENLVRVDEKMKRPQRIEVRWDGGLPAFEGVIESIGTKYTMFLPSGAPVRATVGLRVREARTASVGHCKVDEQCPEGQVCVNLTCQAP
jgi:hypothetical protein